MKKKILVVHAQPLSPYDLMDGPLESCIDKLQELHEAARARFPSCELELDLSQDYDEMYLNLIVRRLETDDEYTGRMAATALKQEKARLANEVRKQRVIEKQKAAEKAELELLHRLFTKYGVPK